MSLRPALAAAALMAAAPALAQQSGAPPVQVIHPGQPGFMTTCSNPGCPNLSQLPLSLTQPERA